MSTRDLLENLADAVEHLAGDHKARITRIEARRAHLAVKVDKIMRPLTQIRAAFDEFESQMRREIEELVRLEDAELSETDGELEEVSGSFLETAKANGDASRH
jgi:hypothetical protein